VDILTLPEMVGFFIDLNAWWQGKDNGMDSITEKDLQDYVRRGRRAIRNSDMNPGTKKRLEQYLFSLTYEQFQSTEQYSDIRELFLEPEKQRLKLLKG
jgi:hypothetical protein